MALFGFFKKTNPTSEKKMPEEKKEDIIDLHIAPKQEVRIETEKKIEVGTSDIKNDGRRMSQNSNKEE